ncbi:MAG: universal stress protein [Bacillota bacterium]|nr:universal stress protein [Bacillota bacterium]
MFKRIVLGTDGSEDSLKAARLCKSLLESDPSCTLVVLHAHKPFALVYGYDLEHSAIDAAAVDEALREAAQKSLEITMEVFGDHQAGVTGVIEQGDAGRLIVAKARDAGADLVVVGSRGLSGVTSLLMGSVSTHVVHASPCSVLVVR